MRPLSATECISPAIERTKLMLFSPFRLGRTWKLCATAYLCRTGTFYLPFPLIYLAFIPFVFHAGTMAVVALCVGIALLTALFTWIFHLCSRIQFAYFDMVVNRGEFVAPAWSKYRSQSLRWTGFKILIGSAVMLVSAVPIVAAVRHFLPLFSAIAATKPGQPPSPQLAGAIAAFYGGYFLFALGFGLAFLLGSLLADFVLPSLALENTSLSQAFHRMTESIRREPGEFAIYVLIKIGLAVAAYMGAVIAWEIVFLLASLIVGGVVVLIGFLLALVGVPKLLLTVVGVVLAIVWFIFATTYSMFLAIGPILTFLDAYAIYFLGGRYPMLGDLLDRSTPLPLAPPPYPAPTAYPAYTPPPDPAT
jgi:hypothetical protein